MSQELDDALRQPLLPSRRSANRVTPLSDTAFPSILLMGVGLVLVIALVGITGWKVLNLDQERENIDLQRAALERDKKAFEQYSGDLPQFEKQHGELATSITQLEGTQKSLQQIVDRLAQQRQVLADESARLGGENTELTSSIDAARKELGQTQSELTRARPLMATAKTELAALQSQEAALRTDVSDLQKKAATLTADIQGLERSRAHAQGLLARITEDQKVLEGFKKSVDAMGTQLQTSLAKADTASNEYARQTKSIQAATHNLDAEVVAMQTHLHTVESHIATLERHGSSFSQLLTQGGTSTQALQAQVQNWAAENKRLVTTIQALEAQAQQWTQRSQVPLAKIKEVEEKLLPIANSLAVIVQSLTTQAYTLKTQLDGMRDNASHAQNSFTSLDQHMQTFVVATADFQSSVRLASDNSEALSKLIVIMQQDLATLSDAIASLQAQKQNSPANQ